MAPGSPYVRKVRAFPVGMWSRRAPLMSQFDMELTERCDNDCIHCCINRPADDKIAARRELDTAEIKDILAQGAALGAMTVRFTGGEPLIRTDFSDIYLAARRLGLKVMLFTNARNITPELAALFRRVPPREKIEVSVYGMHRKSYEAVSRVPGSFRQFRRGVKLLLDNGIPFVVKGAVLPPNRGERREFERWARTIPGMEGRPPQYSMFYDLRCRRDDPRRDRLIRKLRLPPRDGAEWHGERGAEYAEEMRQFCSKFLGPSGAALFPCGMGGQICVDAYGRAQGCLLLRAPEMVYDLRAGSLMGAAAEFFPAKAKVKTRNPAYLDRCGKCFLKSLCEQCPAKSFLENGTLDTPVEYLCDVAHAQAEKIGLIAPGEKAWTVADWRARIGLLGPAGDRARPPIARPRSGRKGARLTGRRGR